MLNKENEEEKRGENRREERRGEERRGEERRGEEKRRGAQRQTNQFCVSKNGSFNGLLFLFFLNNSFK